MGIQDEFGQLKEAAQNLLQNAARRYEEPLRQERIRVESLNAQIAAERARAQQQIDTLEAKLASIDSELRVQRLRNEELEGQTRADQDLKGRFIDERRQYQNTILELQRTLKSQAEHNHHAAKSVQYAQARIVQLETAIKKYHQTCQTLFERDRSFRKSWDGARLQFQGMTKEIQSYRTWIIRFQTEQKSLHTRWMEAQKLAGDKQQEVSAVKLEASRLTDALANVSATLEKERKDAKEWEGVQFQEIENFKAKIHTLERARAELEGKFKEAETRVYVERTKYDSLMSGFRDQIRKQADEIERLSQTYRASSEDSQQRHEAKRQSLQKTIDQLSLNLGLAVGEREKLEKEIQFLRLEVDRLRLEYPVRDLLKNKESEIDHVSKELEKEGLQNERREKLGDFLDILVEQKSCLNRMLNDKQAESAAIAELSDVKVISPPRFVPRSVPSC